MTTEFFRKYIDIIQEASAPVNPNDDMFAPRQHQQIAQVFDQLAKDQFQFAQEEREEDDDPEAGEGYEDDGASYLEVAAAFRRGLALGLEAWSSLDTMLAENSAETVEDALGINLSELQDQLTESDDMFAPRRHQQVAQVFDQLAKDQMEFARQSREENAGEEYVDDYTDADGYENDGERYQEVALAFRRGMQAGIEEWRHLDTMLRENSAETVEDALGIDLYELQDQM